MLQFASRCHKRWQFILRVDCSMKTSQACKVLRAVDPALPLTGAIVARAKLRASDAQHLMKARLARVIRRMANSTYHLSNPTAHQLYIVF